MKDYAISNLGIKRNSFILSFIIVFVLFLSIITIFPVKYSMNDDAAIVTILTGSDGFPPDPHGIFINPITSYAIFLVNKYFPLIPFFDLIVYIVTFIAFSLITSIFLRSNNYIGLFISIPVLVYFIFLFSSFISFTTATLLMSIAVLLCTLELLVCKNLPIKKINNYIMILAICFLLSFLLRWQLILIFIVMSIPMLLFVSKQINKKSVQVIGVTFIIIIANGVLIYLDNSTYSSFMEYNKLRSEFHDTYKGDNYGPTTQNVCAKIGWTYEDYYIFRGCWFLYDNTAVNKNNLKTLIKENNAHINLNVLIKNTKLRIYSAILSDINAIVIILLSLACIIFYNVNKVEKLTSRKHCKIIGAVSSLVLIIVAFMGYRFPERISWPILLYFYGFIYILTDNMGNSIDIKKEKVNTVQKISVFTKAIIVVTMLCTTLIVGRSVTILVKRLNIEFADQKYINYALRSVSIDDVFSEKIIIPYDPTETGAYSMQPFRKSRINCNIKVMPSGWMINSPHYDKALSSIDIKNGAELLRRMVDNRDFLIMHYVRGKNSMYRLKLLEEYVSRRITKKKRVKLIPRYTYANKNGIGLNFYSIESL